MATGYVSIIDNKRKFGFINSPDLLEEQLFFHKGNCNKPYKHIFKGDEVNFDIDQNSTKGPMAINISFMQNKSIDELRNDFKNEISLKGLLKRINDEYFVIDKDRNVLIPLVIAKYETNLSNVYTKNINKIIDYKIITFTDKNKIKAIKIDRQFLKECKLLVEGNRTEGVVVAFNNVGYQIKVYKNIIGFLPNILVLKSERTINIGEIINVICIKADENSENVVFDLTENIDNDSNFYLEKVKFKSSLQPGDKYLGKIKSARSNGVFIYFGLCFGLLQTNKIIKDNIELLEESRKEFSKIMKEIFLKGQEIDVIVFENTDKRISLTWDIQSERNKKLYENINTKFNLMISSK